MARKKKIVREDLQIKHPSLFEKYQELLIRQKKSFFVLPILLILAMPFTIDKSVSFLFLFNILLFMIVNTFLLKIRKVGLTQEDVVGQYKIGEKKPVLDKYLLFGYAVEKIEDIPNPAEVFSKRPHVLQYPIFIDKDFTLRHGLIVGTTGSGKTVLIRCLLSQVLEAGGGLLIVDGKADQLTYEDFYNTTVAFKREDDFYMLNLSEPSESNTMNPLMSGGVDDIAELLSNMLGEAGGDNQYWVERGQILMKGLLSVLIPLKDRNGLFYPDGKPAAGLDFTLLTKWLGLNELYQLFFKIKNENDKISPEHPNYIELKRLESYLMSNGCDVQKQAKEVPPEAIRQHGFAVSQWTSPLDTLMGTYGIVFDTQTPEIDMFDVITGGRILYVMLPALKKSEATLKSLGKLVLATLKISLVALLGDQLSGSVDERYKGFAARPRVPFLAIMDEYGAYAVKGFDNVLAQARSLQVGVIIAVQELASLQKADEIEAKRILGNTAFKIALKMTEDDTIETFLKIAGENEVASASENSESANEKSFNVSKKSLLDGNVLKGLAGGQGFAIINGRLSPMLVAFYEPPVTRIIPRFKDVQASVLGKVLLRSYIESVDKLKEMYLKDLEVEEIIDHLYVDQYSPEKTSQVYEELLKIKHNPTNSIQFLENNLSEKVNSLLNRDKIDIDKIKKEIELNIEKLDKIISTINSTVKESSY